MMSFSISNFHSTFVSQTPLFAASSNVSARGLRDNFQALATATANLHGMTDHFLFRAIVTTKPMFDAYFDALRRIPSQHVDAKAVEEVRKVYQLSLRGNEAAQGVLKSAMTQLASSFFSHRPHWLITDETKKAIGPVANRNPSLTENAPLLGYQVSINGTEIKTIEPDPVRITIDGLHVSTETVLLMRTHRIVFVPGPSGVGKSGHIIGHLKEQFANELGPDEVLVADVTDRRNGIGTFTRKTHKPENGHEKLPLVTIIDNAPLLQTDPVHSSRFAWCVKNYLEGDPNRSIILFGGTSWPLEEQMKVMCNVLEDLLKSDEWRDSWAYLPVQLQPLNMVQQQQVLAPAGIKRGKREAAKEDRRSKTSIVNKMTPRECEVYTDEVSIRTAPFLPAIRPFALTQANLRRHNALPNATQISSFADLKTAFSFLATMYRPHIAEALRKSNVVPFGSEREETFLTGQIESIIQYFDLDFQIALDRLRDSRV